MTAIPMPLRRSRRAAPAATTEASAAADPKASLAPRWRAVRAALVLATVLTSGFLVHVTLVGGLRQQAAQQRAFDALRRDLAEGTAPVAAGAPELVGKPVAHLRIPAIGLEQVVLEGTAGAQLLDGPGHRRDTPLPGQLGTSVVFGRRTSFGGPFGKLPELRTGDRIEVTTGQGSFEYRVTGLRRDGDPVPPASSSTSGWLMLATADGRPYVPDGVLRVDAELVAEAVAGARPAASLAELAGGEQLMGVDSGAFAGLALWLVGLLVALAGGSWAWHRWGGVRAWIVFLPLVLLAGAGAADHAGRLLPNLL